jgi:hypothetical protein
MICNNKYLTEKFRADDQGIGVRLLVGHKVCPFAMLSRPDLGLALPLIQQLTAGKGE